ncbi:MAG: BON domain-containing protein [Candidatus Eremiobacteraeota bacterium]|nr:BON domain-containing protein [Candidatus Eremiobacteraeota bacterium]
MKNVMLTVALLASASGCTQTDRNTAQDQANKAIQGLNNAASSMATSAPVLAARDALLATAVKARLVAADVDSAGSISVRARSGAVTIVGAVRSPAEIPTLREAARQVAGVSHVALDLHVDPHLPSTRQSAQDLALATRVMAALAAQSGTNALRVHAAARGGVVTLDGTAPTQAVKATMLNAASKTNGVRRVIDRLTVRA